MTRSHRFRRGLNNVISCRSCGKRTTNDAGEGTGLCKDCYVEAGLENEHQDGMHEEPVMTCPLCRAERSS